MNRISSLLSLIALTAIVTACAEGEIGATGPEGERGTEGSPGSQGENGEDGDDGDQGDPGNDGDQGVRGPKGPRGFEGNPGETGETGLTGEDAPIRPAGLQLAFLGRYETGLFDEAAAEIVAYDAELARVFVVNAFASTVDVLDLTDPSDPVLLDTIDATDAGAMLGAANSIAVSDGLLAVAIQADDKVSAGLVAFYDTDSLSLLGTATVGSLPDMLTFTPDGSRVLVVNEGEPDDDYLVDPEGSISIITVPVTWVAPLTVQTAGFAAFESSIDDLREAGVRLFGPGASVAEDLEPEYLTVSADGTTAYATLQENNALGVIDIATATVVDILPLGLKNHNLLGNELDPSDRDDGANLRNWPVYGMYMPDTIASYEVAGETYLVTANEGDVREWGGVTDGERLSDLVLDATAFPNAAELQDDAALGRLNVSPYTGDTDGDLDIDVLHAIGARSFSIWRASTAELVYDSGNDFELRLAKRLGDNFNSNHTSNDSGDSRSDDKGPEPEALALAEIGGSTFAFIGLERTSGIMVYDVTLPEAPRFVTYASSRNFEIDFDDSIPAEVSMAGDLGPECIRFVSAEESPNDMPLIIVGNEVSGTTAIFSVTPLYGTIE